MPHVTRLIWVGVLLDIGLGVTAASRGEAQGCEPIRFAAPAIGGATTLVPKGREWRVTLGYRHSRPNQTA